MGQDRNKDILSLPGAMAPEKEIFESAAAKECLEKMYSFDMNAFLVGNPEFDHHKYAEHIAGKKSCSREVLEADCIRAFIRSQKDDWADQLCNDIRERIR